ncbi:hypothetical protein Tco_0714813, partial [Tanacetum coccineum]
LLLCAHVLRISESLPELFKSSLFIHAGELAVNDPVDMSEVQLDLVVVNSVRKLLLSDSCEELKVVGMVGLGDIQSNLDLLSDIEIEFGCSDNMDNNKHDVPLGPK